MLVAAVGTFVAGFDQLVAAADHACAKLGLDGFAQIGQSSITPTTMRWERFLPQERLIATFQQARVVVCHAGMGIVGEALRANVPIVLFPRQGPTRRGHPANDQTEFACRIAERHGLLVCSDGDALPDLVTGLLREPAKRNYRLGSDIPAILGTWLSTHGGTSPNHRSRTGTV
ncbi:MAG TPA: glycosyltransferase [Geminicoccus sp.]|jgi:UDP-N-acetylglucosamine transferase subunit ALG13|uniref:glycosyltransferase n=1 Tax=Geminicoccus sp. TaxID=2024832 RepID=UPI002E327DD9|nr:glycosyltransferase [Geminicoccus sp.]HEX2525795.1 glycosyltransferase [Geminicoccus sp.]